jgi:hypothetical protein
LDNYWLIGSGVAISSFKESTYNSKLYIMKWKCNIMKGKRSHTSLWMITTSEYITKLKGKQGRREKKSTGGPGAWGLLSQKVKMQNSLDPCLPSSGTWGWEGAQLLVSDRLQVVRVCDHAQVVVAGVGIEVVTRWVILAGSVIGVTG